MATMPMGAALFVSLGCALMGHAQTVELRASANHDAEKVVHAAGVPAAMETTVNTKATLLQADGSRRGELWLNISADADGASPAHVTLRIPLSSTEDVYGESRSCKIGPGGAREFTFTAGMDENNFLRFAPAQKEQEIHLLLNKYLCRALAAPFHCDGQEVALPGDWSRWRLGSSVSLVLSSDAPASLAASPVIINQTDKPFNSARCAIIAPSNGLCCVSGKTTEWHCGGTPKGTGWHQVSGECFHRETGGTCNDKTVFGPLQPLE